MIDIHTHNPHIQGVYNLTFDELLLSAYPNPNQKLSVGIHPWWVTSDWEQVFNHVQRWARNPQVQWIGETGLDRLRGAEMALQKEVFTAHATLSEQVGKPLLIHCVKALDELLAIKNQLQPKQQWIFHGFRGKPQQMNQLLKAGFHISFGPHFNADSLNACPPAFRYMETDDSGLSLEEVALLQKTL